MSDWFARLGDEGRFRFRIPIATKLILSFLLIITLISAVFVVVGIRLIGDRIVAEAQEKVRYDLNAAREIYLNKLGHIDNVVRFSADRFFLINSLLSGNIGLATDELTKIKNREGLDILTVTDASGKVLLRTNNVDYFQDDQSDDELVSAVLFQGEPVSATSIVPDHELSRESPVLAEMACCEVIDTPLARVRDETEITDGMMLKAAAPVFDYENNLIGVLYGGVLLNKNFEIVDKIKQTVFEDVIYDERDLGTATIFQDDVRISTNVRNTDGSRAIGTRVSEEVFIQVVKEGKPWTGRAYVVNDWYITAYEPIRNINNEIIGILYVGELEQKYVDIQRQTVLAFLAITLLGALAAMSLAYVISRRISIPIRELASASREIEQGNLDAEVEIVGSDELGELAETFNAMASALKERDKQLMEFTQSKIMESERLALIGQIAANVAHELNNPLQGIVTYSHLLLEKMPSENSARESLNKIVIQANRCRDIIRGLLDFSRQRKPDKTICDINSVLDECVALIENQALFHNIEITKQFEEDLPMVVVDPSQMQQVFMNMIINAAEAMEDSGYLELVTRFVPDEELIAIEITDSGQGISEENVEKLFDPFFTTKEVGHGTGLGLAISYGIIKEHEGTISVDTELGHGTTFLIQLPMKTVEEGSDGRR
ncbi:MAG: cache domain-containing protein [Anaerolineaceae bacterium]|nr:MAG: cache domain-containing protein [Anaerolineaceae bacterium]